MFGTVLAQLAEFLSIQAQDFIEDNVGETPRVLP